MIQDLDKTSYQISSTPEDQTCTRREDNEVKDDDNDGPPFTDETHNPEEVDPSQSEDSIQPSISASQLSGPNLRAKQTNPSYLSDIAALIDDIDLWDQLRRRQSDDPGRIKFLRFFSPASLRLKCLGKRINDKWVNLNTDHKGDVATEGVRELESSERINRTLTSSFFAFLRRLLARKATSNDGELHLPNFLEVNAKLLEEFDAANQDRISAAFAEFKNSGTQSGWPSSPHLVEVPASRLVRRHHIQYDTVFEPEVCPGRHVPLVRGNVRPMESPKPPRPVSATQGGEVETLVAIVKIQA